MSIPLGSRGNAVLQGQIAIGTALVSQCFVPLWDIYWNDNGESLLITAHGNQSLGTRADM